MDSNKNELAEELIAMADADKAMRSHHQQTGEYDSSVDDTNRERLKEIVRVYGWPLISMVGKEAASAAWLLAQHSDPEPQFQAECLGIMENLPANEIARDELAFFEDRVRVNQGLPQIYGTQFYKRDGVFGPRPIEDLEHLDERREAAKLGPFAAYEKLMRSLQDKYYS